ncbi:MAG: lactonase family protein [Deinococcota bacterium]
MTNRQVTQDFFVGCYTGRFFGGMARGKGIYRCRLEPATGAMSVLQVTPSRPNPSYLALNSQKTCLYAVHELEADDDEDPSVSAFALQGDALTYLNTQPSLGNAPCHLTVDAANNVLAVANYGTGNVALYKLAANGSLETLKDTVQHTGSSVNPARQEGPHAHAVAFDPSNIDASNTYLFVTDLGTDQVKTYHVVDDKLRELAVLDMPAGSGPRHLAFHPSEPVVFVINELSSSVSVLQVDGPNLQLLSTTLTLPEDATIENTCAAIRVHPNGKFVYASNRGHDSIAVFAFDSVSKGLEPIQVIPTGGKTPREINFDPSRRVLIAANQDSDSLVSFWCDEQTGQLTPTGEVLEVGTPVCVVML